MKQCSASGFTLIEVLLVVAIGAIIVGMSATAFSLYHTRQVEQRALVDYQLAKELAVLAERLHRLGFRHSQTITVKQLDELTVTEAGRKALIKKIVGLAKKRVSGDTFYNVSFQQNHAHVSFKLAQDIHLLADSAVVQRVADNQQQGTDWVQVSSARTKPLGREARITQLLDQTSEAR